MGAHASCCAAGNGNGKSMPPGWARGFTTDDANGEEAANVDNSDAVTQEAVLKVEPDVAPTAGEEPSSPPTKDLEEPTAEAPEATEQKCEQKSLYDRIGSEAAVDAAVEQFYAKLLADESLAPLFASSDMGSLKGMQKKFLTMAFGGPSDYSGKSLKDAHQDKGITNDQFGAVAGHLSATLTQLGVPGPEHDEVMAIAASTQGDIVEESVKDATAAKDDAAGKADPGKADEKPKTSKTTSTTKTKAKSKAKSKAPVPAKKEEAKTEEAKKEEVKKEEPKKEEGGEKDLDAIWKAMSKDEQEEKGEKLRDLAGKGSFTAVTALLVAGVSTEAKHKDGFTALHYAAENGHMETVEILLKYKADCTATLVRGEWGMTPLHFAARKGHKDVTKLLVKKGKKALKMKNYKGKTPAEIATGAAQEYLDDL